MSLLNSLVAKVILLELVVLGMTLALITGSIWLLTGALPRLDTVNSSAMLQAAGIGIGIASISMIVIGYFFAYGLTQPIRYLDAAARRLVAGDLSTEIKLQRQDEYGDLARSMNDVRQKWRDATETATLEKNRHAAVLESINAAIVITDHEHRIVSLNSAAELILAQERENLVGTPWAKLLVSSGQLASVTSPFRSFGESDNQRQQFHSIRGRFSLQARPEVVLEVISTCLQVDDTVQGYVHLLENASALEYFVRANHEFLSSVAHELSGPISSQRVFIESLLDDYASYDRRDLRAMIQMLHRTVIKFQWLLDNLVDIGRLRAGRFTVHPEPTDLTLVIQDTITQIKPLLQSKGQTLDLQIETPPGCFILADRRRIIQVLLNILQNAYKYAPENQPLKLITFRKGDFAYVEVTDFGPGIPIDDQPQIFERFYRVKRVEKEGAGIGLGLALAKGIIEAHHGQIGLRSQIGEGATFWFSVPLAHVRR